MSKKILSLVLAAVMLVLAVPVMALTAAAEEPVYSTSFGIVDNDPKNCKNLPTFDEAGNVVYHGNWVPVAFDIGAYSDPDSARIMDADCSKVGLRIDGAIAPEGIMAGGGSPNFKIFGQGYGGNTTYWAYYGQIGVTASFSAGIRYTAEKSGNIEIILDAVGKMARLGLDSDEFRYGIYHNGVMVWPKTDGTALGDTQPLHELFADLTAYEDLSDDWPVKPDGTGVEAYRNVKAISDLFVFEGDTLDFIVEMVPEDGQWYNAFSGLGNVFFPTINYKSTLQETQVSASVALTDGFALSLGFAHIDPIYTNVRVKVNGETLTANEDGKYLYDDIAIKEIGEELEWQVTGMIGTKSMLLAEGTTNIAALLYNGFVKDQEDSALRRLAIATLNYGAEAQKYFSGMTSGLANAGLSADEKTITLSEAYTEKTVVAVENENATIDIASASLLLNNTVDVKYVIVTTDDIGNYRLQVSATSDFADAEEIAFAKCKKGRQEVPYTFKAIIEDISADAWDDVMYVRVIDKTNGNAVVSDTLSYSAAIYYARMAEAADGADMLKAMMAVNEAAAAYVAG